MHMHKLQNTDEKKNIVNKNIKKKLLLIIVTEQQC